MAGKKTEPSIRASWRGLRWARRITQGVSLALFLLLIGATASLTGDSFDATTSAEVPLPVEAYLLIDPLLGATTLLSSWSIPGWTILGLIVLGSAALLGRAFCGWICPMGTMNHLVSAIRPGKRGKRRLEANRTRPYQKAKYVVLVGVLVAALCGSAVGGLLDPIAMATRGVSLTFLPLLNWILGGAITGGAESNVAALQGASDGLYDAIGDVIFYQRGIIVGGGMLISVLFLAVLVVNRWIPRFWCRGLCPLGAMLGVSGRFGVLTLAKDEGRCDDCSKCQLACSGAASPRAKDRWQRAECDLCMNCVATCPKDALEFELAGRKTDEQPLPDVRRRTVLAGAAAGAVLVPVMRTGALGSPRGRPDPACIRPPGALEEEEFLARCVRCGQCMKICPENALHPALDEAGIEGLWTPVLIPRIGYCQPSCTLCTQVCPTAALRRVREDEKTGANGAEMVRLGTAFIDRGRCLPWAMGTPCQVCEEFCPTSPTSIWMNEVEVQVRGQPVKLKQPHVDPAQCNGCGACEFVCPVNDKAAIRVTSAGESRSQSNALLLGKRRGRG
jgi:MauM/NapG family ferredoxin protein